jgi:hypothetical protein
MHMNDIDICHRLKQLSLRFSYGSCATIVDDVSQDGRKKQKYLTRHAQIFPKYSLSKFGVASV